MDTTLSIVLNNMASIDRISPYAYFFAEKVAQILNSTDDNNIDINVPNFEIETDSSETTGRMKQQIYQMRLDSGGLYRFKTIVIGDHEVGKTSIVRQFVERKFSYDYRATIGLNILAHSLELYGNEVNFSLWDVGAQIYFKRFRRTYYQGTQAAFIIFDLTNRESYDNIMTWYNELMEFTTSHDIPIIIVGNKVDLTDSRKISYQEGVKLVSKLTAKNPEHQISYIETSALTGENVEDAFALIAYHYIMKTKQSEEQRLNKDLMNQINEILNRKLRLTLSFITENEYWSPGMQIMTDINQLCDCERIHDDRNRKTYEYSNGLVVKNFLFNNIDVSDSDGVFVIFDARNKQHIDPVWRNVVITIIETIKQNKIVLI